LNEKFFKRALLCVSALQRARQSDVLDDVAAMKALGTHRTLMLAALEAGKVGNPRQRFSYLTVTSITLAASLRARFRWGSPRYEMRSKKKQGKQSMS
jgi:hypothetical protein